MFITPDFLMVQIAHSDAPKCTEGSGVDRASSANAAANSGSVTVYRDVAGTLVRARWASDDLPLGELVEAGLAERDRAKLGLTERGLELSDAIGPWLYSPRVEALTAEYEAR